MAYKLSDVCDVRDGTHDSPTYVEVGYPLVTSKNIVDGKLDLSVVNYITEEDYHKINERSNVHMGDIIMPMIGTIGNPYLVEEYTDFAIKNVVLIKFNTGKVINKYIWYFLQSEAFARYVASKNKGGTQKFLALGDIRNLEIPTKTIAEQEEIIQQLDGVTKIIDLRKQELEEFDNLIKSRFVELFGDMTENPNGWEVISLGNVCDVRDGTHDSPKYFTEGYPLVTSKNVTNGKIDFTDCSLICEEDYNKINERSKVDYGDILMPMIGTVGKPVIVDVEAEFAIKNVALIKVYEDSKVTNIFVKALLQSVYFDRVVISKIRGGTQKFIALGDIRKLEICLPPMETQKQFAVFVKQTDKMKFEVQKSLKETQLLLDSLMQKYFE